MAVSVQLLLVDSSHDIRIAVGEIAEDLYRTTP